VVGSCEHSDVPSVSIEVRIFFCLADYSRTVLNVDYCSST
jgi:hypothetical protein